MNFLSAEPAPAPAPGKENMMLEFFFKLSSNCLKYVLTHVQVHIGLNLCLL